MWFFIRRIPNGTTRKELGKFIGKGLRPSWMFIPLLSSAKLKRCEILQIFHPDSKTTEYHGLVQIEPSGAALPVIKRLDGRELQGKLIEVRKYFRRSSYRDRRRLFTEHKEQQERRRQDRRREGLSSRVLHAPDVGRTLGIR